MSSLLVIVIPLALTIIGIIWLNGFNIVHDQPEYSLDEDPVNKLAAERQANYHYFRLQRARILKRQKRVCQYAWLVLAVFVASSWLMYSDAVKATTVSKQISEIQTLAVADSKDTILSLTLKDGSHVQYVVKALAPLGASTAGSEQRSETLANWQFASLVTAVSIGDATLPLGIGLRISN